MDNELKHWGVKGMKWGVRRYQNKDGSLTPAGQKRYADNTHEDYRKAHDRKPVSQMSDKELRERNNRLNMENQYAQMTKKKNRGEEAVKLIAATTAAVVTIENAYKVYKRYEPTIKSSIDKIGDWVVKGIDFTKPLTD